MFLLQSQQRLLTDFPSDSIHAESSTQTFAQTQQNAEHLFEVITHDQCFTPLAALHEFTSDSYGSQRTCAPTSATC